MTSRRVRRWAGAGLLTMALALLLAPRLASRPAGERVGAPFQAPGPGLPLGTDHLGRDVWSQVLHDAGATIGVPLLATAVLVGVATVAGLLLGSVPDRVARPVAALLDVLVVVPPLVLVLVVVAGAGGGAVGVVLAVVVSGVGILTRVVAAATRQVSVAGHVEVARGYGASAARVLVDEVLPRIARTVIAESGLRLVAAVQVVAALGFLGVASGTGRSWATAIRDGAVGMSLNGWAVAGPCLALAVVLVALTVLVDLLRDGAG
ncbi:ABC transporter permease subunit [Nocardioides zeae]|uniref:Peptide/nickel transport system permease protein n=1 Tax=Nocardioides zeae TaxID=1457234 RepID=A0AAJ1U0P7_9ACTN|nr:ABC transporter permease subunit [Nocardioides zeae]MDQ1105425.1 peptide/nickel transport system permease protein [Nocardioides zeae]